MTSSLSPNRSFQPAGRWLPALLVLFLVGLGTVAAQNLPAEPPAIDSPGTNGPAADAAAAAEATNDYRGLRFRGLVYRVPPRARLAAHMGAVIGLVALMAVVTRAAIRKLRPPLDQSDLRKLWYLCFFVLVLLAGGLWGIQPRWQGRFVVIGGCLVLATLCRAAADLYSKLLAKKMMQGLGALLAQQADRTSAAE